MSRSAGDDRVIDPSLIEFRRRAESDMLFFAEHVLGYKEVNERLHRPVVDSLCDHEKSRKKLFLLPRGHLKSSLVNVAFSLWLLCTNPNRTISIFSETTDLAKSFLREIKTHIRENPRIRMLWNLYPENPTLWTAEQIIVNRTRIARQPSVEAMGINEATVGRHPDVMILDDVVSARTVTNEEQIRKSKQTFQELQALLEPSKKEDPFVGYEVVVGTRWHWDDLYGFIIEELSDYWDITVRAAIENGEVIFPEKFSKPYLAELRKTLGPWVFSAQYLNAPVDEENATFPAKLIEQRTFRIDPREFIERVPCRTYLTADPAWEGADAAGILIGARAANKKLYILEDHQLRLPPDQTLESIAALAVRWRVEKIGFEGVIGGQEWMAKNLQKMLMDQQRNIPVITLSHGNRSKHARLLGIVPELADGRLMIHEGCTKLRTEMIRYPRGKTDDLLDALQMMVSFATSPGLAWNYEDPPERVPGTGEHEVSQLEKRADRAARARRMQQRRGGMPWR